MKKPFLLIFAVLLSACSSNLKWPQAQSSPRLEAASDWSRNLPAYYPAMMNCLSSHPSQPAYAGEIVPVGDKKIDVRMVGSNDQRLSCVIGIKKQKPEHIGRLAEPDLYGPFFTPVWMPQPSYDCTETVPVESTAGKLLGWVTYTGCSNG